MATISKTEIVRTDVALWHRFDPELAVEAAIALYGPSAATAAAWCAALAQSDGRESDYRFWLGVFKRLTA